MMFHKVVQVLPTDAYKVYLYFADGKIKVFDAGSLVKEGIFRQLQDKTGFKDTCTVLNDTLAWDISGNLDPENCHLDPEVLYNSCPEVKESNYHSMKSTHTSPAPSIPGGPSYMPSGKSSSRP
ncbi:MAG: DUF2442 domain-containing protein [Bacillota bacterium]